MPLGVWCWRPHLIFIHQVQGYSGPAAGVTNLRRRGQLPVGPVLGIGHSSMMHLVLGALESGAGAFHLPLNTVARVTAARPQASPTYATGPGVFQLLVVAGGLVPALCNVPLHMEARRAAPRSLASLTYAAGPAASCGTAAGVTNLCHRAGRLQLVVAGGLVPAPFNLPLHTGQGAAAQSPASPT